jgi:hypothetical protein
VEIIVVQRRDVPDPHRRDVERDREDGRGEDAGAPLDAEHPPRDRAQDRARQPEDDQDRGDVQQQQVLDHVHEEQLLTERVDGAEQRHGGHGDPGEEQRELQRVLADRAPADRVPAGRGEQEHDRAGGERPRGVG